MRIVFSILIAITLNSCESQVFTEKEKEFTNKISSLLNGASVKLKKGVVASASEGNFYKIEIFIDSLVIENGNKTRLLFASSIPAYLYSKEDTVEKVNYKYLDVVVNTDGEKISTRYSMKQLSLVDSCIKAVNGFMYGLKELNKDSITSYSDPQIFDKIELSTLLINLKTAESKVGKADDIILNGFRFEEIGGKTYIHFSLCLKRQAGDHIVDLWTDPLTHNVSSFDF